MRILATLALFLLSSSLFAERWLIVPPRIESPAGVKQLPSPADLARAMALYLRVSRVGEIVQVGEVEGCLAQAHVSFEHRVAPESLRAVLKYCMAERMLLTRIRVKPNSVEVLSKVYFGSSDQITDSLVTRGESLSITLGENLQERFSKKPAVSKEVNRDLLVVGDTYGGSHFDWPHLKNLYLSVRAFKTSFCLTNSQGKMHALNGQIDKGAQKAFLDKLRSEGSGTYENADELFACAQKSLALARQEGRGVQLVVAASDFPRPARAQIALRAQLRRYARSARIVIATASGATDETQSFWQRVARELGESSSYTPLAQRVKVGLSSGQEWFVFRRSGRLYESKRENPDSLSGGVQISEKYAASNAPADLVKIYESLSGNKVISAAPVEYYGATLQNLLAKAFAPTRTESAAWRILLEQNGQKYYLSLTPKDAQRLSIGAFVRIFVELKDPRGTEILVNSPNPALLVDAVDSSQLLEIDARSYIAKPSHYLRQSFAGRSFYILSGKVLRIVTPNEDALDSIF